MSSDRVAKIEAILKDSFSPLQLQIKDQSHLHAGHEGAKSGGGHYQVTIVSQAFDGCRPLKRHQMIYAALGSMMQSDIHALRIVAKTPEEP